MKGRANRVALIIAASVLAGHAAGARQASSVTPKSGSVIVGRVVEAPGTQGVADTVVSLSRRDGGGVLSRLTDATGRFVFLNVPDGVYVLEADHPGYRSGTYGQRKLTDRGRDFVVAGQSTADVTIPLWKTAEISGTVTDESGEPLVRHSVYAMVGVPRAGRLIWMRDGSRIVTDDHGAYRISGLDPSEYVVVVPQADTALEVAGQSFVHPFVFYPGASMPGAAVPLRLGVGETRAGINFQVRRVPAYRITGTVTGVESLAKLPVRLAMRDKSSDTAIEVGLTQTDPSGRFVFPAVPAGEYRVSVWSPAGREGGIVAIGSYGLDLAPSSAAPSRPVSGSASVVVFDRDIDDLPIAISSAVTISGRVVLAGSSSQLPAEILQIGVVASPIADTGFVWGGLDPKGNFQISIPVGSYFVRPNYSPTGFMLESVTSSGRDILDTPVVVGDRGVDDIVISVSDKITTVTGTARASDAQGRVGPDPDAVVLIFPADDTRWVDYGFSSPRLRTGRVAVDGTFTISGLPAGDYFAVAVGGETAEDWQVGATLRRLAPRATRVRVVSGQKAAVDLRTWTGR